MAGRTTSHILVAVLEVVAILLGVFFGFYALDSYIDNKIEKKVESADYIRRVASNVRPYVIFNTKGTILTDAGGMQYIENIRVEGEQDLHIVVTPKLLLAHAPLLNCIDEYKYTQNVVRGSKYDWEYNLHLYMSTGGNEIPRFRLEIIP